MIYKNRIVCFRIFIGILLTGCFLVFGGQKADAAVNDPTTFGSAVWDILSDNPKIGDSGGIQSMCLTENYIVCLQNRGKGEPDTLLAYYRYDQDEQNNPVERFGFAFEVTDRDYEHGNGMTYNPETNEILIATGSRISDPNNRGCIFVVDGDTLQYKKTVKITDEFNITGIAYSLYRNEYVMQANTEGNFAYVILDMDYQIIDDIPHNEQEGGRNAYQDICVSGDYLISIISDMNYQDTNYLQFYSISRREYWGWTYITLPGEEEHREAESMIEIEPGRFIMGLVTKNSNPIRFCETQLYANYGIVTRAVHGKITETVMGLVSGQDYEIEFQPDKHYRLSKLLVDGKSQKIEKNQKSYVVKDIQSDVVVKAVFKKLPKYPVSTEAENGTIAQVKPVYEGESKKITFQPNEHYELSQLLVNGKPVEVEPGATEYALTEVAEDQTVKAVFQKIPSFTLSTSVVNGTISQKEKQIYRGSDGSISYQPKTGFVLLAVLVDKKTVDTRTYSEGYVFQNVQGEHSIQVIYVWKYLWLCLGGGAAFLLWGFWYACLLKKRKKKCKVNVIENIANE